MTQGVLESNYTVALPLQLFRLCNNPPSLTGKAPINDHWVPGNPGSAIASANKGRQRLIRSDLRFVTSQE